MFARNLNLLLPYFSFMAFVFGRFLTAILYLPFLLIQDKYYFLSKPGFHYAATIFFILWSSFLLSSFGGGSALHLNHIRPQEYAGPGLDI